MNASPQPPSARAQAPKKSAAPLLLLALLGFFAVTAGVGGALFFALGRGDGRKDVGDLEALRGVQAALKTIDACRMELNTRKVGANQDPGTILRVYPCNADLFASPVRFPIPPAYKHLSFIAERSSVSDRWKIRVDQSRVAFGELTQALEAIAPELAAKYPAMRAAKEAHEKAEGETLERERLERERARQKTKESYPSK